MLHPVSQPYVPHYDSVQPCRVPAWILETIHTRNTVTFRYTSCHRMPLPLDAPRCVFLSFLLSHPLRPPPNDISLSDHFPSSMLRISHPSTAAHSSAAAEAAARDKAFHARLRQYPHNPDLFLAALRETLEADVRSKFQTKRRQEDAAKGVRGNNGDNPSLCTSLHQPFR